MSYEVLPFIYSEQFYIVIFQEKIIIAMKQGCLMSLLFSNQENAVKQAEFPPPNLYFPVYVITESVNSSHLRPLQMLFQKENILISFQKEVHLLQKIPQTYQNRFFIIFNDFKNDPQLEGEFKHIKFQVEAYPQTDLDLLMKKYKAFVAEEMGYQTPQLKFPKDRKQHNSQMEYEQQLKGKIKLKSVSKIWHNYKSVWPKRLFVYCNSKDDEYYKAYISRIKQMSFHNTVFIDQIEEYVHALPQKEDVSFCILMSYYSAEHLRKYFKKSDEILILTSQKDKCLPLLRGKVTFFTADYQCMDAVLRKTFGMTQKKVYSSKLKIDDQQGTNNIRPNSLLSLTHSFSSDTFMKQSQLKTSSSSKFTITKQFQMCNEYFKEMALQSNAFSLIVMPANEIIQKQQFERNVYAKSETPSKEKSDFRRKRQNILIEFTKVSPLRVVQMENVSIANASIKSSESNQLPFQELFNRINFEQLNLSLLEQSKSFSSSIKKISSCSSPSQSKQNISGVNDNGSSRFSRESSHNSRIIARIRDGAIGKKNKKEKIEFERVE